MSRIAMSRRYIAAAFAAATILAFASPASTQDDRCIAYLKKHGLSPQLSPELRWQLVLSDAMRQFCRVRSGPIQVVTCDNSKTGEVVLAQPITDCFERMKKDPDWQPTARYTCCSGFLPARKSKRR